jgi:hypothetical protein
MKIIKNYCLNSMFAGGFIRGSHSIGLYSFCTANKRFYSTSTSSTSKSGKEQCNYFSLDNFLLFDGIIIENFFNNIQVIREKSDVFPYSKYFWEDNVSNIQEDLYNYFYKKFLWDYFLVIDGELEPGIDFEYIYIVFLKTDPDYKFTMKESDNKENFNMMYYSNSFNMWYYEEISLSEINELRNKFINAYKENMFDDLHNSISDFTHNIVEHLMELYSEEYLNDTYSNLYINLLIPSNKGINLSVQNKKNIYHNHEDRKFYSTSTKAYNKINLKLRLYNNNPLIFKCNNVYRRHLYKLNPLNKLFYTTEQSNINHKVGLWSHKNRNNINHFNLNYEDLNYETILHNLKEHLIINNTYSLLIKVTYSSESGTKYFMLFDRQFGINYYSEKALAIQLKDRYSIIKDRLHYYELKYEIDEFNIIQFLYVPNNSYEKLKLKNVNKENLDKGIVNVQKTKTLFNNNLLPLSINEIHYGEKLTFTVNDNKQVSSLFINDIDFLSTVRQVSDAQSPLNFSSSTRFYLYSVNKSKQYIISVEDINSNQSIKNVYDLQGYKVIDNIIDTKLSGNSFTRQMGNVKFEFTYDKVSKKYINVSLPLLKYKPEKKHQKFSTNSMVNNSIGSFDIETFIDSDGVPKVYALGFSTLNMLNEGKEPYLYYLKDNGNTPEEIVLNCINDMLKSPNDDHIYYTHNLGGYDVVFLLKILWDYNKKSGHEYYKLKTILRDNKILKLTIQVKINTVYKRIVLIDSYNLLTDNLDSLSKAFGSDTKKGLFPYLFVNNQTLNYKGNTPSIEYYKVKNKTISLERYQEIFKTDWCLKTETLQYLKQDILSLLEIMDTYNKYIFIEHGVQVTESLTISRLALNIFLKKYLKATALPVINNKSVFNFIKAAYYGGIVEVYKPHGNNLYYYDVNSLYPFSAKNPMPGNKCEFIEWSKPIKLTPQSKLFGFFYCKIQTTNDYLGLLPVHNKGLIMPNGEWYGTYFSEELKFACENGYKIEVYKGYVFNKVYNAFDEFIDHFYQIKATSKGSERLITKLLLNSLLGRFGMSILKLVTEILSLEKYKKILCTKEINSLVNLSSDNFLISYNNELNKEIIKEHGLDYIQILNQKSNINIENSHNFDDVAISIAAAVTSYSRIYMSKFKLHIFKSGGKIFYSDTDSLVTDIKLDDKFVGKDIGQFKLEYELKEAYFISSKTYCLILKDEYVTDKNKGIIIKAKGLFENSLTVESFKTMYYLKQSVKGLKNNSITNYSEGYVKIETQKINLDYNVYKKRNKIYSRSGLWIDTRPLYYYPDEQLINGVKSNKNLIDHSELVNIYSLSTIFTSLYLISFKKAMLSLIPYILYITSYSMCSPYLSGLLSSLSLVLYIYYVTPTSICLTYHDFYYPKALVPYIIYISHEGVAFANHIGVSSSLSLIPYVYYVTLLNVCLTHQQFHNKIYISLVTHIDQSWEIPNSYSRLPKSVPDIVKGKIVRVTKHELILEINNSKKLITSIQKNLNAFKESERKRKRNEKDRERRRILKEQNPKLYEERKSKRNEKDRERNACLRLKKK